MFLFFNVCGPARFPVCSSVFAHMHARCVAPTNVTRERTHVHTRAGQTCVVMATHTDVNKRGSRVNIVSLLSSRVQFISMQP